MPKDFDTDDPVELVRRDLEAGLGAFFTPERDAGFALNSNLAGEPIGEPGRVVAVPWRYECRHTGEFQGLFPTDRTLTVDGVTFVDQREGKAQLHRYVDWMGALTQLGVTVSWRVPVPDDQYRRGLRDVNQRSREELNRDLNR